MKQFLLLFLLLPSLCFAQHEDLLQIIGEESTIEIRQKKIDSFLNANERSLEPKILADCYHDLGSKWYYRNWPTNEEDIDRAIAYTKRALKIKRALKNLEEGSFEKTAYNLGYFYYSKENFYEAINSYLSVIEYGTENRKIQSANRELGKIYEIVGDFYKAIDHFTNYIDYYSIKNNLDKKEVLNLADVHIRKGGLFSLMDHTSFAEEIESQLVTADSLLKIVDEGKTLHSSRINQLRGNTLVERGEFERAIFYHKEVLLDSMVLSEFNLASVLNSLAFSQLKLGRYNFAEQNLKKSIALDQNYSNPYENLGDLHLAQSEFKKALYNYQKAMVYASDRTRDVQFEELLSIQDLELAPEKISLLNHIVTKANGWLKYYEFDKKKEHLVHALKTFRLADQLVDIIRFESTEYQSKLFWREKGASLYTKAVEACFLLDKPREAYYFMERNKALLLLEDVTNEQAKDIVQLPDSIAQREFDLKRAILLAENELQTNTEVAEVELENLRNEIYGNKRKYNQFVDSLSTAFPEYTKIKRKVEVLPYADFIENFISKDEVVLQYILNDEQGYGLLSSADRTHFFKLDKVNLLNEDLVTLYSQLTDMTSNREKMIGYSELSNSVFRQLIPKEVYSQINGKKLTIVSDHILQQIPFESFVVDKEKARYLIEVVEIRYAYSMSYLDAKKEIDQNPQKELLGLAPIQFASLGLPELAFSGEEVGEAEKIYKGDVALNDNATKSKLLADLNDYKIVHLSTHADVGEDGNPWIAFSDEKLFLNEIYANKNQADMVVLSGCNTSLGELKKGEGAMSLARGFFHSGAKSVVSSLWTINDKTSKDLMIAFYKGLDKGLTKAAALRKAKIDYIEKYRGTAISPSFWAALIIIGDNSPITNSGWANFSWAWIALGLGMILFLGFFLFKMKTRHAVIPKRSAAQ